jgi:hypothetical protein
MGISLWENRLLSPWVCSKPLVYPRCLVLLSRPIEQNAKILNGMLSVLNLTPETLSIAWLKPEYQGQISVMINSLSAWSPDAILIMGQELGLQLQAYKTGFVQITYHPDDLQKAPEKKPEAYGNLLKLKQYLSI